MPTLFTPSATMPLPPAVELYLGNAILERQQVVNAASAPTVRFAPWNAGDPFNPWKLINPAYMAATPPAAGTASYYKAYVMELLPFYARVLPGLPGRLYFKTDAVAPEMWSPCTIGLGGTSLALLYHSVRKNLTMTVKRCESEINRGKWNVGQAVFWESSRVPPLKTPTSAWAELDVIVKNVWNLQTVEPAGSSIEQLMSDAAYWREYGEVPPYDPDTDFVRRSEAGTEGSWTEVTPTCWLAREIKFYACCGNPTNVPENMYIFDKNGVTELGEYKEWFSWDTKVVAGSAINVVSSILGRLTVLPKNTLPERETGIHYRGWSTKAEHWASSKWAFNYI